MEISIDAAIKTTTKTVVKQKSAFILAEVAPESGKVWSARRLF